MEIHYTLKETAEDAGISYQSLYYLNKVGAIQATKKGRVWVVTGDVHHELVAYYRLGHDCWRCEKKKANFRWRFMGPYCADCGRVIRTQEAKAKQRILDCTHMIAQGDALTLRESVFGNQTDLAILALLQATAVLQLSETPLLEMKTFTAAANLLGLDLTEIQIKERLLTSEVVRVEALSVKGDPEEEEEEENEDA